MDKALTLLRSVDAASLAAADQRGVIHYDITGYGMADFPVKDFLLVWSLPMFVCEFIPSQLQEQEVSFTDNACSPSRHCI